jgi:hypothetical protein
MMYNGWNNDYSGGFRHSGGGLKKKGNFSTSKASKVRSHWGGLDLKGGVEYSILPGMCFVYASKLKNKNKFAPPDDEEYGSLGGQH